MKLLSSILVFLTFTSVASQCSPQLSFTSASSSGTQTSLFTDVISEQAIAPDPTNPPATSIVAVILNKPVTSAKEVATLTCNFTVTGSGDAAGRLGVRFVAGSLVSSAIYKLKVNGTEVESTTTTTTKSFTRQLAIGQTVSLVISTASVTGAVTARACLQVAQAPPLTVSGSLNPVLLSHSFTDGSTFTDTDPFREGYQITQGGKLNVTYAINSVTLIRPAMFAHFTYNSTTYPDIPSFFIDYFYYELIVKLVAGDTSYPFYKSNIELRETIPASSSGMVIDYKKLSAAVIPTIPSGTWFMPQYQVKLYQNCGTVGAPVFQLIDDEASPLPATQIQMLSKPTVTATGLDMTAFRRAYPTEVPITIMFGSVPAEGKQVIVQDETNTTLCSRILDANGQTTVPVVVPSNFVNATFARKIRWISDEPLWNSVDLIKSGLSVRNTYSNSLAGKLTLEGGYSRPSDIACMIRLQKIVAGAVESTQYRYPVMLDNGNYQLQDIDPGTYRVLIAPIKYQLDSPDKLRWLSLLLGEMTLANSSQSLGNNASLHSGDIAGEGGIGTRDNEVNLFDLSALIARYGTNVRSSTWNDEADMDADGEVTLFDVMVIDRNFMAKGDD
ncbi:MAG: hypothetical protein ACYC1M_04155 [Armatimonadota bacterium]